MLDFTKGYLPVVTVASMLLFVIWVTKVVVEAKVEVDNKFKENSKVILELAESTKDLADVIAIRGRFWWSRDDMYYWCEQQKVKIPAMTCPTLTGQSFSKILDSTEPVEKSIKHLERVLKNEALKEGRE